MDKYKLESILIQDYCLSDAEDIASETEWGQEILAQIIERFPRHERQQAASLICQLATEISDEHGWGTPAELTAVETDAVQLMTADEARAAIEQIRQGLDQINEGFKSLRQIAWELANREGYKALGYSSLRECFKNQLANSSLSKLYREVQAGDVEFLLGAAPEELGRIPESVVRPLHGLPQEQQVKAYTQAQAITQSPDGVPTAKEVAQAAAPFKQPPSPAPEPAQEPKEQPEPEVAKLPKLPFEIVEAATKVLGEDWFEALRTWEQVASYHLDQLVYWVDPADPDPGLVLMGLKNRGLRGLKRALIIAEEPLKVVFTMLPSALYCLFPAGPHRVHWSVWYWVDRPLSLEDKPFIQSFSNGRVLVPMEEGDLLASLAEEEIAELEQEV